MPTYDYRCLKCKKRFDVFLSYQEYGKKPVTCPHCQSDQVTRKIGRVRVARSTADRLQNLSDPGSLEGLEEDPKALGKMMRQMSSEMGEDLGPEFHEVVNRLEAGQDPEQIEKDMPDLGAALGGDEAGGMPSGMEEY